MIPLSTRSLAWGRTVAAAAPFERCSTSMCPAAAASLIIKMPLSARAQSSLTTQHQQSWTSRRRALRVREKLAAPLAFRPASTITTSSPQTSPLSSPSSSTSEQYLTWNQFLALRRSRRRTGLVFSIVTAMASTGVGLSVLSSRDLDAAVAAAIGLDPLIVLGLSTTGLAALGWLIGPFVGNAVFGIYYRNLRNEIAKKDRAFYHRISQRRVDPSSSSIQNPVPDYYGEKIGSVADYRRWLKDQRAFHLKRSGGAGNIAEAGKMVRSGKNTKT